MLAVILDMDGLMLDTEPIAQRVWKLAATHYGRHLSDETCRAMIGLTVIDCKPILLSHFGRDFPFDEFEALARANYRDCLEREGVPPKPGLFELIDFLDERAVPRAVATSTHTALAIQKLDRVGVLGRIHALVGGDQIARGKPAPDIFLAAAQKLNSHPSRCVVLEDSAVGIRAAVAAGMRAIWVPDGVPADPMPSAMAYATASSLIEAIAIIDDLWQNQGT